MIDSATQSIKSQSNKDNLQGVGDRHSNNHPLSGGGGYLDNYKKNFFEFKDPKIQELAKIGLAYKWIQIAEAIGFENWIMAWKILDQENNGLKAGFRDFYRIRIPHYARYIRYQRNLRINSLDRLGLNEKEIKKVLDSEGYEPILESHIKKIIFNAKIA